MPVPSALAAALADRYRLERELGAGGMATVYLAHDVKHDRKVAVKVLKPELAAVLGAERFVVEIKTTAALQHPHILPLFDSGEADGFLYYVMPFIDGETLRAKLDRETQLSVDEAVRLTSDVAEALQYAHEQGVIHRDIKPENILLAKGRPMVADFGIALAVSAAAGGRMTETGLSLGTPHYMSPEQATAEKEISARSDVYSLASVCYEMLAGEPPHMGNSAQQIIMKIITDVPRPLSELRKSVPPNVAAAVAKALEKLPADRFASAGAFAQALGDPAFRFGMHAATAGSPAIAGGRPRLAVVGAGMLLALAAGLGVGYGVWSRNDASAAAVPSVAFEVSGSDGLEPSVGRSNENPLAISPDGTRIVFNVEQADRTLLAVRELDSFDTQVLAGTENARDRVFSPDGRSIVFRVGSAFMRAELDGSPPVRVGTLDRLNALTALVWMPGDTLYYISEGERSVFKQAMDGRSLPERFAIPDSVERAIAGLSPVPGTEWLLSSVLLSGELLGNVLAFSTRTHAFRTLNFRGIAPQVLPGGGVILLYSPNGVVTASAFDAERLATTGPEVVVLDGVAATLNRPPVFALADNGTVVFATGDTPDRTLVEVTRDGRVSPILADPGAYKDPRWSPDGQRLAFEITSGILGDIWIFDLRSKTRTRLTSGSENLYPNWMPDGERIVFASRRDGASGVWWQRVDGAAPAEALQSDDDGVLRFPHSITPDGRTLLFRVNAAASGIDILAMDLAPGGETRDVLVGPANDGAPVISPDGRWLAFVSDVTGRNEVYVTPWPVVGRRAQLSNGGGEEPIWNPRGGELFYRTSDALVAAMLSERNGLLEAARRDTLFRGPYLTLSRWPQYDVSADGKRFVMVRLGESQGRLRVITNFDALVRRRLAARAEVP